MPAPPDKQRLDKWLWHARFYKTRALAAAKITAGSLRLDGKRVTKRATSVRPGHVLSFMQSHRLRVIEIIALAERRAPASEAQSLYTDHSASSTDQHSVPDNPAFEGKGRPSKRARRQSDLSRAKSLE